jgi:adenylate kinase family enzyme
VSVTETVTRPTPIRAPIAPAELAKIMPEKTLFILTGPRAVGKNTILKILKSVFGKKIHIGDSSDHIGRFIQNMPDTVEAQALIEGKAETIIGGLQPDGAAVAANLTMIARGLRESPFAEVVVIAGCPRSVEQLHLMKELGAKLRFIHITCTKEESFDGAFKRQNDGEVRTDVALASLEKAWRIYNERTLPMFKEIDLGHVCTVKRSDELQRKMTSIITFVGRSLKWKNEQIKTSIECLTTRRHPANLLIRGVNTGIAEYERKKKQVEEAFSRPQPSADHEWHRGDLFIPQGLLNENLAQASA